MVDPKPGSFSAYLEYSQRKPEFSRAPVSGPTSLLAIIQQKQGHTVGTGELADLSSMNGPEFQDALQKLATSGFIEVLGAPIPSTVRLTEKGEEVLKLLS
jgi:Mn-dependent DtxR family transcriptional regulator